MKFKGYKTIFNIGCKQLLVFIISVTFTIYLAVTCFSYCYTLSNKVNGYNYSKDLKTICKENADKFITGYYFQSQYYLTGFTNIVESKLLETTIKGVKNQQSKRICPVIIKTHIAETNDYDFPYEAFYDYFVPIEDKQYFYQAYFRFDKTGKINNLKFVFIE